MLKCHIKYVRLTIIRERYFMDKYLLDHYIKKDNKFGFASIFGEFNLEDFVKLSDRVDIRTTNHGHSSYMIVNGQKVKEDADNTYVYLLTYIHYLGTKIKDFYKNMHHMNTMGFDYPDVFTYINKETQRKVAFIYV